MSKSVAYDCSFRAWRVEEDADLGRLPHEEVLHLGDGDLAGLHPNMQMNGLDGVRRDRAALQGRVETLSGGGEVVP